MKRKNNKIYKAIIILSILMFVLLLNGCGISNPLNEDDLIDSINSTETELSFVTFDSMNIDKRQTNKESKTDEVYCTISGSSAYADFNAECVLYSNYYDQGGWILDSVAINSYDYNVHTTMPEEDAVEYFDNNYYIFFASPATSYEATNVEQTYVSDDNAYASYTMDFTSSLVAELSYEATGTLTLSFVYDGSCDQWGYSDNTYEITSQYIDGLEGDWSIWAEGENPDSPGWTEFTYNGDGYDYAYIYGSGERGKEYSLEYDVLQGTFFKYPTNGEGYKGEFDWYNGGLINYIRGDTGTYTESFRIH